MKTTELKLTFIIIILFSFLGCSEIEKDKNLIMIGATIDLTGPNAVYGKQVKEGIDLAIGYINDSINKSEKAIEVIYLDSRDIDREAISNINMLISIEKIKLIIGGISSNVVKSMIPTIESNNAFLFAPASSGSILNNISSNFARNWPSDDLEAGFAAKYAYQKFGTKHPAIVYVNSYYGIGLKTKFISEINRSGVSLVDTLSYEVDQVDFKTIIGKLKEKKPDCIYLAGNPREMGRFMKQLKEQQVKCSVISNTGFLQDDCLNIAKESANGVVVPTPRISEVNNQLHSVMLFNDLYTKKFHSTPTLVTANSFDAVMLIYEVVKNKGNDPLIVASTIRNMKAYNGASGLINFTNGEIQTEISYFEIKNSIPVEILK